MFTLFIISKKNRIGDYSTVIPLEVDLCAEVVGTSVVGIVLVSLRDPIMSFVNYVEMYDRFLWNTKTLLCNESYLFIPKKM